MGRVIKARPILIAAIFKVLPICCILKVAARQLLTYGAFPIQEREVPS